MLCSRFGHQQGKDNACNGGKYNPDHVSSPQNLKVEASIPAAGKPAVILF